MKYFISDLHNGDKGVFVYGKRNQRFKNLKEMYDTIVKNWNSVVHDTDDVFLLGDVGEIGILSELNGNITIVCGNHDNANEIKSAYPHIEVSRHPIMVGPLWLSHEPITFMPPEIPYLNVHGHLHQMRYLGPGNTWDEGNRYLNVSVEQPYVDYTPISEIKITEIIGYKPNTYERIY